MDRTAHQSAIDLNSSYKLIYLNEAGIIVGGRHSDNNESIGKRLINKDFSVFFSKSEINSFQPQQLLDTAAKNGVAFYKQIQNDNNQFVTDYTIVAGYSAKKIAGYSVVIKKNSAPLSEDEQERKKARLIAEETLRHKEERLNQAQKVAHIGCWELDCSTGIATWTDEHCRIYGEPVSNNKHTFESWFAFVHPEDKERVMKLVKEAQASFSDYSFDHRIVRKDGTIAYLYSHVNFEFDSEKKPAGIFGITRDVTDEKHIEEKLAHSEYRLKQAQNVAHVGSWELTFASGNAIWSDEACRIYGLPVTDNRHTFEEWLSFIHPEDLPAVNKYIEEANKTFRNTEFYHRIVRRDGSIRYIHSRSFFEFDVSGKPVGMYGIAHDFTGQRINLQQLRMQNDQLRQIAWIQSHKVRGPLATIMGLAELFKIQGPEHAAQIIDGIMESSRQLDDVIREIVSKTSTLDISSDQELGAI